MQKTNFKFNWPLIGNVQIVEFLEKIIIKGEVSGTYIFSGPDNLGKATTAVNFAQILLCQNRSSKSMPCENCPACQHFLAYRKKEELENKAENEQENLIYTHSDFHLIKKDKDKKNISIEQVRDFIRNLNLSSFFNSYKIGIIKHADCLSNEASNALLKTLEEPKDKVIIILIAQDVNSINQTIASRSKVLNFRPVPADIIYNYLMQKGASRNEAKTFSRLSLGRPALALKFFENNIFYENYREKAKIFVNLFGQDLNSRILSINNLFDKKTTGQELVKKTKRTLEIWQGTCRDLLFLEFNNENIVQNHFLEDELKVVKSYLDAGRLVRIFKLIEAGRANLEANVNPKLVLENLAINL